MTNPAIVAKKTLKYFIQLLYITDLSPPLHPYYILACTRPIHVLGIINNFYGSIPRARLVSSLSATLKVKRKPISNSMQITAGTSR